MVYNSPVKTVILSFFKKQSGVAGVYLFGSQAKKKIKKESDVDIAVLFEEGFVPDFRSQLEMREALSASLNKEVDLVLLNRGNPILKYQVLKYGELLLNNNPSWVNNFFVRTLMEYDDLKRVRAPIEKNILRGRTYGR